MTEEYAPYNVRGELGGLTQFKQRQCCLPLFSPDFLPPTAAEVAHLRRLLNLSQKQLGALLGKSVSAKGCPAVRKWETEGSEHRKMDVAAWRYLLAAAGIIDPGADLAQLRAEFPARRV